MDSLEIAPLLAKSLIAKIERIQEENSPLLNSQSFANVGYDGGWYKTRRQYRSVAFGTWKVGGARDISTKRDSSKGGTQLSKLLDTNQNYIMPAANRYYTLYSLKSSKSRLLLNCNQTSGGAAQGIQDYAILERERKERVPESRSINISELDKANGNVNANDIDVNDDRSEMIDAHNSCNAQKKRFSSRYYGSLSRRKKDKFEKGIQKHQRSRSAGNDNLFSLQVSSCKQSFSDMSIQSNHTGGGGSLNPLKATKKFLKKIYDSATLPGRSYLKASIPNKTTRPEILIATTSPTLPFVNVHNATTVLHDAQTCSTNLNTRSDLDSTPSMIKSRGTFHSVADSNNTVNDSNLLKSISSNDFQNKSDDFRSWDDVFYHLKREMDYMKKRDAQIFADLQFVELQLKNVRNGVVATLKSEMSNSVKNNSNNNTFLQRKQIKLGELVESMPI